MKIVRDGINSFLGGVNTSSAPDHLEANQIQIGENARTSDRYGGVSTRAGSQRIHTDLLPTNPSLIRQWDAPGGTEEVVVVNGDFYHKAAASAVFTQVDLTIDETLPPGSVTHRESGAPRLFIGDGTSLYKWDGTTMSTVAGAPAVRKLEVYKGRGFGCHNDKNLHNSAVDDLTDWSIASGGATYPIETYDADPLNGLLTIGGSLIMTKENNVSRYSGVGRYEVRVDTLTDGISSEVGCIAPQTLIRVEDVGFMISDRGPYLISESGVKEIGLRVEPSFDFTDRTVWAGAVATHNRRRKEIWLFVGDAWWVYNYRTHNWMGPWDIEGYTANALGRYERSTGQESVMIAGTDGRIRDGDVEQYGARDDIAYDGTGGALVPMSVTLRELTFGRPHNLKGLYPTQVIKADLVDNGELTATWSDENGYSVVTSHPSTGTGLKDYPVRPGLQGNRITLKLADQSGELIRIDGVSLAAKLGRKTL